MPKGNPKGNPNIAKYAWKPGQSGNPQGVSKAVRQFHDSFKGELIRQLSAPSRFDPKGKTTRLQAIVGRLLDAAEGGEIAAVRELLDRLLGKPKQDVSIETENTALQQAFERMSREELTAYAETGMLPKWFETEATGEQPIQ